MPTLDFKGKQHIYAHHLTVPYRPLVPDPARSVPPSDSPPPPGRQSHYPRRQPSRVEGAVASVRRSG